MENEIAVEIKDVVVNKVSLRMSQWNYKVDIADDYWIIFKKMNLI